MYDFADSVFFKVLFNDGTGKRFDNEETAIVFGLASKRPFRIVCRADYNSWKQTCIGTGRDGIYTHNTEPVLEVWNKKPTHNKATPIKTRGWLSAEGLAIEISEDGGRTWIADRKFKL